MPKNTRDPKCNHSPAGRMAWPTGLPEQGEAHASTYVCHRDDCRADAARWVHENTGHLGEFVPFGRPATSVPARPVRTHRDGGVTVSDLSHIPDEAVDRAHDISWGGEQANRRYIRMMLAAALPVLNTATRPRLVSGDIPITERTPHGVWIADGMDPEPSYAVPCGGPSGCDDCRAYDDLRQHLVEQIIALDEQHQREMKALTASRDSETAELRAALDRVKAQHEHTYLDAYSHRTDREKAKWSRCSTCGNLPNGTLDCPTLAAASLRGEQGE